MSERNESNVTFEIKEHIGVIASNDSGWNKELNIVSWNGGTPKYDVRDWDPDHERMSKGITLLDRDMRTLVNLYIARNNRNIVDQGKAAQQEREERRNSIARPNYSKDADEMTMGQILDAEEQELELEDVEEVS